MKPEVLALFDEKLKHEAAARFSLEPESLKMLDGFENVVLEASRNGTPYILRISHGSHRTVDQIHAELDWLDYLSSHGLSVCTPLRSKNGDLVESVGNDHGQFIAVCFEKAAGGLVRRDDWTRETTLNRGKLLGRMHALTRQYRSPSDQIKRYNWYDEDDFISYRKYLPSADTVVADRFAELQQALRAIPTDNDSYGLIHMDAHTGNMFFDGDRPTLFDFDDCAYDFFISDIAISLFYAVLMFPPERDREAFGRDFLNTMLEGYRSEYKLDNRWLEVIPMILKRRELVLYVAIHRGFDSDNFDDWCRRYLDGRKEKIDKRVPYLDLDWSEFDLSN
jgi:Ser/Thr protein kinase RdoA (MazF antagonist)